MDELFVSVPEVTYDAGRKIWRVDCEVAGENLYFESSSELEPVAEGIVGAYLTQAQKMQIPVVSEAPLDRVFLDNMTKAGAVLKRYWGYDGPAPRASTVQRPQQGKSGAIFFTGGVDSFYTLKENLQDVRYLVNVHGFDVNLDDTERQAEVADGLRRVADMLGLEIIQVETNLRSLKVFRELPWEQTFGAALASVGHLLQKHVDRIYVAGGYKTERLGSTPELDVLWGSSTFRMARSDDPDRQTKVEAIVDWEPVKKFLSVCWQHLNSNLNCGECEKCLRTQIGIVMAGGDLKEYEAFPDIDLEHQLPKLNFILPQMRQTWVELHDEVSNPEYKRIIARALFRSRIINVFRYVRFKLSNLRSRMHRLRLGRLKQPNQKPMKPEA